MLCKTMHSNDFDCFSENEIKLEKKIKYERSILKILINKSRHFLLRQYFT